MGQQVQPWRSGDGERLWLSMLVDTLEKLSRRDFDCPPCDQSVLLAVHAHLARVPSPHAFNGSHFSLRN